MKNLRKRVLSLGLSIVVSAAIFVSAGFTAFAYTETTGTVKTSNVKVRSSASTTASQVSSLREGDTIDIVDEATDASGYVWYKIRVNKSEYGYVRSDLVSKKGGSSSSSSTTTTTTTSTTESNGAAAELPATQATAVDAKSATITEESVNVREGAGTKYNSVGKVTKGDTVTITGEATGTDNKTWYQVTFGSSNKTGYVRSDLLQVSEAAPAEGGEGEGAEGGEGEGEVAETPEETEEPQEEEQGPAVTSEAGDGHYSLVYLTDDASGEPIWYLYDNIEGYRVKVNELIDAAKSSDEVNKLVKTNNNYKTILIILAVVVAALVIGLIIMALKLRDSLYYEDEEEEEYDRYSQPSRRRARPDEDEEDERPARRRPSAEERTVRPNRDEDPRAARPSRPVRRDEDAEDRPVRRRPVSDEGDDRPVRPSRPVRRDDEGDRPVRPRRPEGDADGRRSFRDADAEAPAKEAPKRRAKNFIGDEDDFEFEFLDLDDDK
ncbi:hypothetical protein D6855_04805 [Butyrivibrio sp. CB08]|uniref:SH3 domain-containing protein n=1 Tax=Butyrivibrio sp. CB08 TaxID=2364879 RepID=UPI000EA8CAA8|nr:SH3 domain-containing protein [Butyrivibrio sp. CB08]RKM61216.1 hypothetical protein D6855_04805 [Butyrivibrio sp. CB08]